MTTTNADAAVIKKGSDGEIEFTDKDGVKHTYYPSTSIWLDVLELKISVGLADPADGQPPTLYTRLLGKARLEDRSISVVGDPSTKSRELSITLEAQEWVPPSEEPVTEGRLDLKILMGLRSAKGSAMLSFNRADWEIGTKDEWWCACFLPSRFIDALTESVRRGELQSLSLSLGLSKLYKSGHPLAPVSSRSDLYLQPVNAEFTETAQGHVQSIAFNSSHRNLRDEPVAEVGDEPAVEAYAAPSEPQPDPVATAIAGLATRVDALRTTLKWVGGLIIVVLLFMGGHNR